MVAGDSYNRRFDAILEDFRDKDALRRRTIFWDKDLEKHWWWAIKFLETVGKSGIVLNPEKFQDVEFAGFCISSTMVAPLAKYLDAIKLFPAPKNPTDLRSWFRLINQVAGYGHLCKTLDPFLSPKVKFEWTDELQTAFKAGKLEIVKAIEEGVEIFNPHLHMCLRTDWLKEAMGYYLSDGMPLQRRKLSMLHRRLVDLPGRVVLQFRGRVQVCPHRRRSHKPLISLLGEKSLDQVPNVCLFRIKQ